MPFFKSYERRGSPTIKVIVRTHAEERLSGTCFRPQVQLAGNFFHQWRSTSDVLEDPLVSRLFLDYLRELVGEQDFDTHSFMVEHERLIGWASTLVLSDFVDGELEPFEPTRRSTGLRVRQGCLRLLAPKTNLVTLIFELKEESGEPVAVVHSMYPGPDIGEMCDDVSQREGVAFFTWNHPGA